MIVKFADGTYGVRKKVGLGYQYYLSSNGKWWSIPKYVYRKCRHSKKDAIKLYHEYVNLDSVPICAKCGEKLDEI
jgi:hypothetical protein